MRGIRLGTNFAIFVLFFGVALLEAFQTGNWIKAVFWVAIAFWWLTILAEESKCNVHSFRGKRFGAADFYCSMDLISRRII